MAPLSSEDMVAYTLYVDRVESNNFIIEYKSVYVNMFCYEKFLLWGHAGPTSLIWTLILGDSI